MHPLLFLIPLATLASSYVVNTGSTCTLYPESLLYNAPVDDSPSIGSAFTLCGVNSTIIFTNHTFTLASRLNTTNLLNVEILNHGVLQFTDNIGYWRTHAFSVVFQDQVTAWLLGGTNVTYRGLDGGHIHGNGQAWYTYSANRANLPGRPITLTIFNSSGVLLDNLRILQPQFWATLVWASRDVTYTNYLANATSSDPHGGTGNTDGYDSWNSADLVVENATIVTQDDCFAAKGNTTNLLVRNVTCHGGAGMTIGSVGQYPSTPDYVTDVLFEDVRCLGTYECAYVKTWQATPLDATTNGDAGGGGSGVVTNVTFRNFYLQDVNLPIQISQCIYADAGAGVCATSNMNVSNVTWANFTGTSKYNIAASLYCSENHPCPGIVFENVSLESVNATRGEALWNTTLQEEVYQCANLVDARGVPCNRVAEDDFSQYVSGNVQ